MLTHYPTLSALSAALSFNRQRLYQIAKRPGFPPKGRKGYEVKEMLAFLTAEGLQIEPSVGTPAAKDNRNLTDLKADLLKEQHRGRVRCHRLPGRVGGQVIDTHTHRLRADDVPLRPRGLHEGVRLEGLGHG